MESSTNKADMPDLSRVKRRETLCTSCGNACNNGCSWSESLKPVKGWVAEKNKNGYLVIDCPQFTSDAWMREHPEDFDTDGCIRLLEAIIAALRDDYILFPRSRSSIEHFIRSPEASPFFFFADPEDIIKQLRKEMRHTL